MRNNPYNNKKGGLIQTIVIILIAVIILSMLGFDLQKIVASDLVQKNFAYLRDAAVALWNSYLATPFRFFWDTVVVGLLWGNLKMLLGK